MNIVLNAFRVKQGQFKSNKDDNFGLFLIPNSKKKIMTVMSSPLGEGDWDHVSVSMRNKTPSWEDMCMIKKLFFNKDDVVVQYHPKESEYVNIHDHCLHLWKYKATMPTPEKWMV